ncbi:DUF3784 domain-containing protein [Bacillaceae bacterium W0354]
MEDKIVLMIIIASCIVPLVILGIVFMNGKGSFLIAGYNTMSQEEKEKYNIVALLKFMGKMMFALSGSMLLWVLSVAYEMSWLFVIGLALFIAMIAFMIIYINTGNRFKKQNIS